ncbi:MAG: hypothetical protein FJX36_17190 [Alphaproteobacteria bacterium]|nr:hypothetical protein [Alphaproteobacteria bacterium]
MLGALRRQDLASFVAKVFATANPGTRFVPGWPIEAICEHLAACGRGEIDRLIVNLPPRSLKSLIVSVAWPAWLLGRDPTTRVMAASYSERLAVKHALDCRLVLGQRLFGRLDTSKNPIIGEGSSPMTARQAVQPTDCAQFVAVVFRAAR